MSRIPDLRLLNKEDFDAKDQGFIDRLSFPINNFMQQVVNVLKNGIDFNNLNQQINTITVSVDAFGNPVNTIQFQNSLNTKIQGMVCINAFNESANIRFPSAQPGITFTQNNKALIITNISALSFGENQTNSDTYQLTILSIGANLPTL